MTQDFKLQDVGAPTHNLSLLKVLLEIVQCWIPVLKRISLQTAAIHFMYHWRFQTGNLSVLYCSVHDNIAK